MRQVRRASERHPTAELPYRVLDEAAVGERAVCVKVAEHGTQPGELHHPRLAVEAVACPRDAAILVKLEAVSRTWSAYDPHTGVGKTKPRQQR